MSREGDSSGLNIMTKRTLDNRRLAENVVYTKIFRGKRVCMTIYFTLFVGRVF